MKYWCKHQQHIRMSNHGFIQPEPLDVEGRYCYVLVDIVALLSTFLPSLPLHPLAVELASFLSIMRHQR